MKRKKIKINVYSIVIGYFIISVLLTTVAIAAWFIFPDGITITQKQGLKNNFIWLVIDTFILYGLMKCGKKENKNNCDCGCKDQCFKIDNFSRENVL